MKEPYWEVYVECRGGKEYTELLPYHGDKAFSDEEHEMEEYILNKHAAEGPMFYRASLIEDEPEPEKHDGMWHLQNQHYDD